MKCGYNARNTVEYNWGLYGDSNKQIKDLLGDRKVWDEQIGIDYDTALIRLLAYMPGMILPWHVDNLGNWCRNNKHLNPDIDTQMCDLGPIKRYLVQSRTGTGDTLYNSRTVTFPTTRAERSMTYLYHSHTVRRTWA